MLHDTIAKTTKQKHGFMTLLTIITKVYKKTKDDNTTS